MNNMKKFFAFSIATAMVAGAVWAGTPAVKSLAATYEKDHIYFWNGKSGDECKYVELDGTIPTGYVQVKYLGEDKFETVSSSETTPGESAGGQTPVDSESDYTETKELRFKDVDSENCLTIKVGQTIELAVEGAEKYSSESYEYDWKVSPVSSDSDEPQEIIATVTDGKITGQAEGQVYVNLRIIQLSDNGERLTDVAYAVCKLKVVPADTKETTTEVESSKQNATPIDPKAPTAEAQAKQEQTPESIANYQKWLATYGGGTAAAAGTTTVSGTIGQPGSEAIVNTASGAPVAMFQSNDATNTLLAAPVGVVPSGTKIETVEAGKDSAAFKAAQNRLSSVSRRGTVQKVYGITALNADGSQITTLNGKAAMSMPVPTDVTVPAGRALKVYLIPDNGQPTKLDTLIDQGRVVFEIPKFGTFAFVVE